MSYKLDLHTHSVASPDGGLSLADYAHMLQAGGLDYIAITDHGRVDFALAAQAELGQQIIVGQEVKTSDGELIGLYVHDAIPAGLSPLQTAQHIHQQGGLVYVPHPFETARSGISLAGLDAIAKHLDIIETTNGRAVLQNRSAQAQAWATSHRVPGASSSDAHGRHGWGNTYSIVATAPTPDALPLLLQQATYATLSVGLRGLLYPKWNRLRQKLHHA